MTVDASMLFVSVATELKIIYIRHQRLLVLQISQLFSSSESNESGFGLKRSEDYPEDFLVILNHLANLITTKAFLGPQDWKAPLIIYYKLPEVFSDSIK